MEYDVIIIGVGPAGVSAGLYTKRGNLKTLILYEDESNLEKADKIENYYGFQKGIKGKELYENGIEQAKNIDIDVKQEEVIKIATVESGFYVQTSKNSYKSKAIILATGNKKNRPKIKGIEKYEGKGISYCAICDGFFYRNRSVAVIGSGNYAISETNELINLAKDITILTNGEVAPEFRADNVTIDTRKIEEITGENIVEEVKFADGNKMKTNGIFIAQGVAGSAEFAKKLGAMIKQDKIVVNNKMETNVPGLYACGDCTGGLLQVSKSVYEGTVAGLQVINYLKNLK